LFDAVSISGYSLFQYSSISLGREFVVQVISLTAKYPPVFK